MRYFIGFLITIVLIILLIVMLVGGGGKKAEVPKTSKALYSYANTDAVTSLTVDGPVNYEGKHRQAQILVSQKSVIYNQINGYNGQVVKGQSFPNNQAAFDTFLHALYHYGFTQGDLAKNLQDERGYCPGGNRYIYGLTQGGKTLERFWSTSCGKPRSFLGNADTIKSLFQAQVPNYSTVSSSDTNDTDYNFF